MNGEEKPAGSSTAVKRAPSVEDAAVISRIVTKYFFDQYPQLPFLNFRIHSIESNSKPGFWVVICSYKENVTSDKRINYELHVDKIGGRVAEIKETPAA